MDCRIDRRFWLFQVPLTHSLQGLFHELAPTTLNDALRKGLSLREVVSTQLKMLTANGVLEVLHLQLKHFYPWAVCIHLEPACIKRTLILYPVDLFQICSRSMTMSKLSGYFLQVHCRPPYNTSLRIELNNAGSA